MNNRQVATQQAPASSKRVKLNLNFNYLSSRLIVECHPGDGQEPLHLIRWWKRIFELLDLPLYDPNHHIDRTHFRCLCNMFNASLKRMPKDLKGKFTQFPHSNHTSLQSLLRRCHELYEEDPTKAPTIIFIKEGNHEAVEELCINYSLQIIGAGRDTTFITGGGFKIEGKKGKNHHRNLKVQLSAITVRNTTGCGLIVRAGLSFLCDSMTFTHCDNTGVVASNTTGKLRNCIITQCGWGGIYCESNALIEVEGTQTKVKANGTNCYSDDYNLTALTQDTTIHLFSPLTKESVSNNNNRNGLDFGGSGEIAIVNSLDGTTTIEIIQEAEEETVYE